MQLPTGLSRLVGNQSLRVMRHSPTILFGTGVVGMIGSTVLACRATLNLEHTLDHIERDAHVAKSTAERSEELAEDLKKDLTLIYGRGALDIAKLYAPAIVVGAVSIAALTKSHRILTQRNLALTAAYAAVDRAFADYRKRVVEKYGEEEDDRLRYSTEKITMKNETTGKKETITRVAPGAASMYARFFDQMSPSWSKDPEVNRIFLRCQQDFANDLLKSRGHLFLNEVYDALGLERSTAGQAVGWRVSKDGDNYIDFGVFNDDRQEIRDFVNGREGSVLLDFNVDGVIIDKIEEPKEAISWQNS